jgi:16S rRNA (uracil1498-N3)-methyltransferase
MSGSIRLFVTAPLAVGADVRATAAQAHYLAHVMRRAVGDPVLLFNGFDGEWSARIATLRRDRVSFVAAEQTRAQEPEPDLRLLFAPLKRDATDLVVQKATELGASMITPVITERTNTARINGDRLTAIASEAAEQCERLSVPAIAGPVPLGTQLARWPAGITLFAAIERGGGAPIAGPPGPAALLVGPEGGFARRELDALGAAPFVVSVSLGPRILRAETAAIVGLALLQARAGG